ncbi:RICIN domain-containing protein [Tenacibaculum sp. M341]|uniref:RICIN domain-containing protein n=1 Tax=Tenacibaculum sp. M341 TaxID=2530339 RepID=UPI00104731F3|nr:RICIN domain-containing protein [Tenacibaculum sp. M341]TCI94258.1 T9SS type A sorting domain-containing protein [Tenacibaculum sp. M341]
MKKIKNHFLRCLVLSMLLITQLSHARDIYVSKKGKDSNNGSSSAPYLTIQKASSVAQPGDVIIIGAGTYEEVVRPARSGSAGAPIVYTSKPGEKVIVTAMQALSGWQKDNGSIYKTKVNWDLGQENFILNGNTAMDLARWPDNTDGDPFTLNSKRSKGGSDGNAINAFLLSNELPKKVKNWKDGVVFFYGDRPGSGWIAWKAYITSGSSGRINFKLDKNPQWIRTFHPPKDGGDFYIEGLKDILDYKNEWWFDKNTKELFVYMDGGQIPANKQIKMRRRTLTVDLSSRNYIEVKNLAVLGGEIRMNNNSKNNRIYGVSSFYGNHTVGVQKGFSANKQSILLEGSNNVVEKCEIAFGAANGIKIGGNNNKILNSRIHDFNYLGSYDAPINARGGKNSTFKGNTIFRGGRDGVQFFNNNSVFEYNDVSYSNLINDDCALLYTVGGPHYGEIHHNWFHDAQGRGKLKKAAGIYLDNDAEAFSVHHNVVWNVEWTNIQINWDGKDIDIFNNTFVKAEGGTMGAWHKAGTKFTNVKVWNNITDRKVTDQAGNQETEVTWEPQANKQNNLIDKNSFVNHANNNFKLKPNAKAIDYGRVINGITNGFKGKAPDVGAYELGDNWKPGINWNANLGPTGLGCYGLPGEPCNDPGTPTDDRVDANLADGVYFIQDISEKIRINSPNGRTVNTANTSNDSAKWEIKKTGNYYTIKNLRNNEYLEVPYAACNKNDTTENPNINLGTYNSTEGNHQRWFITKLGEDFFLQPLHCEKVIDRNNGNPMHLWEYFKGNKNQNWRIVSAEEKCSADTVITNVKVRDSQENSLTVSFDNANAVNTYELRAWPKGQFTGNINTPAATAYKSGNTSSLTVDGLQSGVAYTLVLRAICSSGATSKLVEINGTTVDNTPAVDTVSFTNAPTTVEPASSYTFNINYEASDNREIIVQFWTATSWVAQNKASVTKGKGNVSVTVILPSTSVQGNGYIFKTHIRPVGASWQEALDNDQINNVTVKVKQILSDGSYYLESSQLNQRLTARLSDNHNSRMINPNNEKNQQWLFTHISNDVYTIKNVGTNRYLEVPFAKCTNGSNVATWSDDQDSHKKWKIIKNGNSFYNLTPMHCETRALDRAAGASNANVLIWDLSADNGNQKWRIKPLIVTKASKTDIVNNENEINKLQAYPVPFKSYLRLKNNNSLLGTTIKLIDLEGKEVYQNTIKEDTFNTEITINNIEAGMYFMHVINEEGTKVQTIIKK